MVYLTPLIRPVRISGPLVSNAIAIGLLLTSIDDAASRIFLIVFP